MLLLLVVGLGGFVGAIARYALSGLAARPESGFPLGTLLVNVLGCFALGALSIWIEETSRVSAEWRAFLAVGVLGSMTTFSTFGHETLALARAGSMGAALASVAANLGLGLGAIALGRIVARPFL